MSAFQTVMIGALPSALAVARAKLESEGIECRTLDELTIQTDNFLSNAIGGVKLQVPEADFVRASEILLKSGFILDTYEHRPSWINRQLAKPSLVRFFKFSVLALMILVFAIAIAGPIISHMNRPSIETQLTQTKWCLDHMGYNGQTYEPSTYTDNKFVLRLDIACYEFIRFQPDGTLIIPGFGSREIMAKWTLNNLELTITASDTLSHVFDRVYELEIDKEELYLQSDNTYLLAVNNHYIW